MSFFLSSLYFSSSLSLESSKRFIFFTLELTPLKTNLRLYTCMNNFCPFLQLSWLLTSKLAFGSFGIRFSLCNFCLRNLCSHSSQALSLFYGFLFYVIGYTIKQLQNDVPSNYSIEVPWESNHTRNPPLRHTNFFVTTQIQIELSCPLIAIVVIGMINLRDSYSTLGVLLISNLLGMNDFHSIKIILLILKFIRYMSTYIILLNILNLKISCVKI